ncbi:hypothetical protein VPHK469_0155 [Vibrio phage K469]
MKPYNIIANIDSTYFNGVPNRDVLAFLEETYDIGNGQPLWLTYKGRPMVIAYTVVRHGIGVCEVHDVDDLPELMSKLPRAKMKPKELPVDSIVLLKRNLAQHLKESATFISEAQRDERLMETVECFGNKTSICWADYGIGSTSRLVPAVTKYYRSLGYKVESSCSSGWANERIFIEIDRQLLNDRQLAGML